ncbi:DUF6268 family outer membrane beta-barrel protein [Dyadobacter helix]|nr:DUF6268 family outer membrane beta-barrel protein [Dyadobacter sp. CECT 9275]
MAPSKWLTIRHTHAPGKVYRFPGAGTKTFTQEEYFFRAWLPVIHKEKVSVILGPHYRTEQWEMKSSGENPISHMSDWKLRSFGLDLRSLVKLDSSSWLVLTSHISKSGNFGELTARQIPFNYTFSSAFLKRLSPDKEIGAGVMVNRSFKLTVLPVLLFNYNFSENAGLEMILPQRISFRRNLSPSDIIYLKGEAVTRTYYLRQVSATDPGVCRRVDVDLGLSYNRRLGNYAGFEVFGGYRTNLTNKLVEGASPVKTSGLTATVELYVQPPKFKRKK